MFRSETLVFKAHHTCALEAAAELHVQRREAPPPSSFTVTTALRFRIA
jgi:hypothetical protein